MTVKRQKADTENMKKRKVIIPNVDTETTRNNNTMKMQEEIIRIRNNNDVEFRERGVERERERERERGRGREKKDMFTLRSESDTLQGNKGRNNITISNYES